MGEIAKIKGQLQWKNSYNGRVAMWKSTIVIQWKVIQWKITMARL